MSQDIFNKILNDYKELSSLPQVLDKVIKTSQNPDASAADLAKVIMKDPNLTARLLRVVNSPYYGPARQITSIQQAVVTLGLRTTTAIALATSIYDLTSGLKATVDRKKFWRHSLEVALASQKIAEAVGYDSPDEAFVSGLLHDIGILILDASFPEAFGKVWITVMSGVYLTEVEEQTWGTNHARVGRFLLNQWGLPDIICNAVGNHHVVYKDEEGTSEQPLNQIVNLANHISKFRVYNMPPPESKILENKKIMASNLGLSHSHLADIELNLISDVVNESGFLEIEIGSVEEILGEANRMLYRQYLIAENLLQERYKIQQQSTGDRKTYADQEIIREVITAFSQLINSVAVLIRDKVQVIKSAVANSDVNDDGSIINESINAITKGVDTIQAAFEELKKSANPACPQDENHLTDIKERINQQLKSLSKAKRPVEV